MSCFEYVFYYCDKNIRYYLCLYNNYMIGYEMVMYDDNCVQLKELMGIKIKEYSYKK